MRICLLPVAAISATDSAFWLGLYASVVSSAVALITLYAHTFQRVRVVVRDDYFAPIASSQPGAGYMIHGEDMLEAMGVVKEQAVPILVVGISNRGRQPVQITTVSKAYAVNRDLLRDLISQLPVTLEAGHMKSLVAGKDGGYAHGDFKSMRRFFVVDGAGRIYPYRERWRQRVENLLYRRLVIWWRKRGATR